MQAEGSLFQFDATQLLPIQPNVKNLAVEYIANFLSLLNIS